MKDETAIQLRLDQELNLGPIGFQAQSTNTELGPSLVFVADVVVFICLFNSCLTWTLPRYSSTSNCNSGWTWCFGSRKCTQLLIKMFCRSSTRQRCPMQSSLVDYYGESMYMYFMHLGSASLETDTLHITCNYVLWPIYCLCCRFIMRNLCETKH